MQHAPVTWTAADGQREWLERWLYPARDTPLWLALVTFASVVLACGTTCVDDYRAGEHVRLVLAVAITGLVVVPYGRRMTALLRG